MTGKVVQQLNLTEKQLTTDQLEQLSQLLNWLEKREQETASMREIKQVFPNWREVDTELDFYVKKSLIGRQDRRYHRLIPTLSASQLAQIVEEAKRTVVKLLETNGWLKAYIMEEPWLILLAIYHISQQSSLQSVYFLPEIGYACQLLSCHKGENYLYLDHYLENDTKQFKGLANYFTSRSIRKSDQAVHQLIGDVNPAFFMEMAGKQLELLADKQQPRKNKESIFLKTLVMLGYVQEQAGNYQLSSELTFISQKEFNLKELKVQERLSLLIEETLRAQVNSKEEKIGKTILLNELLVKTSNREVVVFT